MAQSATESGYETLPDTDDLPGPAHSQPAPAAALGQHRQQQQQQPAYGQPLIGQPAAVQGDAVLGVPAFPQAQYSLQQHQQHQQQQGFTSFPPYLDNLPPSAEADWDAAVVLMSIWLGCSVATLALATLTFNVLGMIGALCATLGAATHRFPWCRPAAFVGDLGALVGRVFGLAIAAASLSSIVALLSVLISFGLSATCGAASDPTGCAELTEITVFYAIWFSVFTAVNIAVVRRSARMRRLLNPVSSGVVNI
ncbi:hypothetical protein ABPG77_010454 [Micractinium sp. CCAP 211/92]